MAATAGMPPNMARELAFDHDIFVSYAQVDDRPVTGVPEGWVTTLINNLKVRLSQAFGREERFSIWWDRELAKNVDLTPAIFEKIRRTRVLLIILSPGYLASDWCRRERNAFLGLIRERGGDTSCLFVVHREPIERDLVPPEIRDKLGHHFYADRMGGGLRILGEPKPNPDVDRDYYDKLGDLARDLHKGIVALGNAQVPETGGDAARQDGPPGTPAATPGPGDPRRLVYVAETTDDLDPLRDEVVRFLDQFGFGVLPGTWYSRKGAEFEAALQADLERSLLFVQLLDDHSGKRLQGSNESYPRLQHRCAAAAGKPILQWRERSLDLKAIHDRDPGYARLLEESTVQAVDLEAFKAAIVEAADREIERLDRAAEAEIKADEPGPGGIVFVNNEPEDLPLAEQIGEALFDQGFVSILPIQGGKPDEVRRDREQRLLECEGVIVVYGQTPATWVRQQLLDVYRIIHKRRENPIRALAVVMCKPEPKEPYRVKMPGMHEIDCCRGISRDQLGRFIATLAGKGVV
jgi:hypothetical protein